MDVDMTNCPNYATFIQRAERVEEAERMDSNSNASASASVPKKNKSSKSSNGKGKCTTLKTRGFRVFKYIL